MIHEAINAGLAEACGCTTERLENKFADAYSWARPDGWKCIAIYVDGSVLFYNDFSDAIDKPLYSGELCDPHLVPNLIKWAEGRQPVPTKKLKRAYIGSTVCDLGPPTVGDMW